MTAVPKIAITNHAVDQFIARCAPSLSFEAAKKLLVARAPQAARLRERTPKGQGQWRITDPDAVLVTKDDPSCGVVCVTVLAPGAAGATDAEVLAAYDEWQAERAATVFPALDHGTTKAAQRAARAAPLLLAAEPSWEAFDAPGGLDTAKQRKAYRRAVEEELQRLTAIAREAITAAAEDRQGADPIAAIVSLESMVGRVKVAYGADAHGVLDTVRKAVAKQRRRLSAAADRERRANLKKSGSGR